MLFGHKYDIRVKAELSNGQIAKSKIPVEARFITADELVNKVKRLFEKEVRWKYNLEVKNYLEIYDANEEAD